MNMTAAAGVPPLSRSIGQAKQPVARGYLLGCSGGSYCQGQRNEPDCT